mgnify:CR=1 FL=1
MDRYALMDAEAGKPTMIHPSGAKVRVGGMGKVLQFLEPYRGGKRFGNNPL